MLRYKLCVGLPHGVLTEPQCQAISVSGVGFFSQGCQKRNKAFRTRADYAAQPSILNQSIFSHDYYNLVSL